MTMKVAVSQRLLPLRCVVCRAKIIRLRQSTTGIPSSVSQYCLGDRRLDRRRDRLAGLPASQSLHSFSSAASAVSGLSLAGCSSDNEGGRARTSRPSLPGRPHDASRSSHSVGVTFRCYVHTHGGSSIKTKRIPSSLVPLPRSRPSPPVVLSPPPAGTCLHITPRGLSSPRGLVNPQISISPRGYVDSPRGYADSSRGYVHSSRGYADSPRGYAVGPRGYDDGPRGYADSPRGYADSPRGDVVPRVTSLRRAEHDIRVGTFRRRSYAMSDQLPVGARNIRVHIRENKIAPQDGIARLPTITECSELCSDRQADRRSVIRLRSAQRLLSQLELPPSHCPPSPPSSSPTASFLSLSSPSSSSSLSLSSSSLSSFKSSLASPLPPNSGSSSPRIPSLTPHTPPSSPNSPIEETGYSPRCYFRLRAGGCSHASDDSDTGEDSDGDESDGNGCGGDGHFFSTTSSRAVPGSEELSRTSTKSETLLQSGAESEPIEFSNDGTDDDFFALGLTSIERNFARHGPFKEGNRFFSKAPVFGLCENKKIKFDIYQVTPSSTSVTFDGNQNIKNHIPTPGSPVRSGENVSTDKEAVFSKFTVDNSRPANSMKNNKLAHASPDLGNNHCISDKPVNKLTSVSVKIREKAEIEAETKLSETLRKVETNRVVDGAKSGLKKVPKVNRKGPTNSATSDPKLPSKFSYRDNPKYFFYSYTGDSATEVPLANLASSKSSSSLRCSGKYPSGRSMTKSVSSKSLSSKTKGSSKTRLPKSSSSSSRLAKRTIDDAVMRSSSSNKSISSAASTSSNSSICSITSRCSTNSSVSYKSAVSSQSGSSVTKSKMSRSLASSYNEPQLTKSISFARSASQANQVSSSGPPHHSTSFKIAKSFSSAENESPVLGAASIDKKSSSLKAQTMPKPSSCKKSSAYSYTNSLSKLESFFCKSPPVNYNSLECNSPNSKHDTLSSCKSSREGSLSRELDLSSCSSSSASTATVRSYRSLLPAGLRVSHDTTAIRNRENKDASSCTLVNPNQKIIQKEFKKSSESESSPSLQENEVRSEKSSNKEKNLDKNKSVGKEIIERAFKGGKGKSSRLGRSIKGVRWKEGDKEDNNNTPAKKAKPGTENRKNEGGILRSKVFSGRHYYRFK
ncbi:hypothetical protein FHG87_010593 [Trinorchestia longiramus]|nr:hypothetical protein FHG87_010593 [Trinorchestia longiramus]